MDRKSVIVSALKAAASEILKHDPKTVGMAEKSTAGDLVTEADLASEKVIIQTIQTSFPNDLVISEENSTGQELLHSDTLATLSCWVIDPIDGTNNFKRGLSYSGISIAYIENGEIVMGGIFDPYRNTLYFAERGNGAFCNDIPISVSTVKGFGTGTRVCTSNSYAGGGTQANLSRYQALGDVWVDVLGSAVLIMADVASGRLDLYHHNGLKPWDNAAGFLIANEAGAKIVNLKGEPVNWLTHEVVMGNPTLVDLFVNKTNK